MKLRKLIILTLVITSCGNNPQIGMKKTPEKSDNVLHSDKELQSIKKDYGSFVIENTEDSDRHPFTSNPSILHLKDESIPFNDIVPYFKVKDAKRLDFLAKELDDDLYDDLCSIKFPNPRFLKLSSSDTFLLQEYQFLVGNLKIDGCKANILVITDMTEAWGRSYLLMSVNQENKIIDVAEFYTIGGDGGDFISTNLTFRSKTKYEIEIKEGYHTFTTPIDSFTYDMSKKQLIIHDDGEFEFKNILKKKVKELLEAPLPTKDFEKVKK